MALTHDDRDAESPVTKKMMETDKFLGQLQARADRMRELKQSEIAAGKEGEPLLAQWKAHGMTVNVRPDDPQGVLRISVGGGSKTPVPLNYCTIRGSVGACIDLLKRAIRALENEPN